MARGWLRAAIVMLVTLSHAPALADPYDDIADDRFDSMKDVPRHVHAHMSEADKKPEERDEDSSDFIFVPIPRSDPTLGTGLTLAAGYLFTIDDGSQTSLAGVGAFATSNGSWGWGLTGSARFGHDRYRLGVTFGKVALDYDFFGTGASAGRRGVSIPIEQDGDIVVANAAVEIFEDITFGAKARYLQSTVDVPFTIPSAPDLTIPDVELDITSSVAGPTFQWDTRDDQFSPRTGHALNVEYLFSVAEQVERFDFEKLDLTFDYFYPILKSDAVAMRATACRFTGRGPFFELCMLGAGDAFRGYPIGQFRDRAAVTFQTEYRGRFNDRFGYVAFGGIAALAETLEETLDEQILPAGGVGLRYRVSEQFGVDLSLDGTVARDNWAVYLYVGQSF